MKQLLAGVILAGMVSSPVAADGEAPFVKLETVTAAADKEQRAFFGRVVARETVDLAFQVGGLLVQFPVEEGAAVREGQLIAQIELEPYELALAQANAQREEADRTVARYREILGIGATGTDLQDAETRAELAAIAVRYAERDLANASLHAPFDGIVASRIVSNFSTVAAGSPVVRLHDMSELRIEIDVPETLVQRVGRDGSAEIIAEFPLIDRVFPMELREFNAETARTGQTYSITLGTELPQDLTLLPGASARVTARFNADETGMIVPASAIIPENDGSTSVMVFSPAGEAVGTVARVPVTIAPTDDGEVKILSGLEAGQEIVVIGGSRLMDGATVRRFVGFEG